MGVHYMAKKKPVAEFRQTILKTYLLNVVMILPQSALLAKPGLLYLLSIYFARFLPKTQNLGKVNRYDTIHSTYKYRNSVETF